jgi:hypothetical protein
VVLSPGCASFDWYSGYPARGDDFRDLVQRRLDHGTDDHDTDDHDADDHDADDHTRPASPTMTECQS